MKKKANNFNRVQADNFKDFDYLNKLSKDERKFLNIFQNEYYNAFFNDDESVFFNEKNIMLMYERVKANKDVYEDFKKSLSKHNEKAKQSYPKYYQNCYNRFINIVKNQKSWEEDMLTKEIKNYLKYTGNNIELPVKISEYKNPISIPLRYQVLSPLDFLKKEMKRILNYEARYVRAEDLLNRDIYEVNNVIKGEDKMLDLFMAEEKTQDDYDFLDFLDNGNLDDFFKIKTNEILDELKYDFSNDKIIIQCSNYFNNLVKNYESNAMKKFDFVFNLSKLNEILYDYEICSKHTTYSEVKKLKVIYDKFVFNKSETKTKYKIKEKSRRLL